MQYTKEWLKQHVELSELLMAGSIYSEQFSSIVASQYIPQYVHDSVSNVSHPLGVKSVMN